MHKPLRTQRALSFSAIFGNKLSLVYRRICNHQKTRPYPSLCSPCSLWLIQPEHDKKDHLNHEGHEVHEDK